MGAEIDRLELVLGRVSDEERFEIVALMWLYAQAPEHAKLSVMARLQHVLKSEVVDTRLLLATVRQATKELQPAVDAGEVSDDAV